MEASCKKTPITAAEILQLQKLIHARKRRLEARKEWLGNDNNKLRGTYAAVAEDTRRLEEHLQELINEFNNQKK